jgi:hypothetical protein
MDATAGEIAPRRRAEPAQVARLLIEAVLALALAAMLVAAFVGLGASSYWIDELWTLFVAGHSQGAGEVLRRALTDTHPPLYFLIIHYWMGAFGDGEAAARSFSAICAVAASVLFVAGPRKAFSRSGRLFGAAVGASSFYWFKQSQNLRSYALAMLVLTALLSCAVEARRRNRAEPVSLRLCAAIAALGLLGALTHYYLFLAVGLVYFALLVSVPDQRLRATVVAAGGVIVGCVLLYMRLERGRLLFTNLWFSNDASSLAAAARNTWEQSVDPWAKQALAVLAVGGLYGLARRARGSRGADAPGGAAPLGRWAAALALFVALGLAIAGLAISFLIQPSFSARNLMIATPSLWFAAAWLYDEAALGAPRAGPVFAAAAAALMVLQLAPLNGRLLNRTEDWRGSAQYIDGIPACRGREIPVVLPDVFGPDTPFFRRLAERDLFGRYYRGGGRLSAWTRRELAGSRDPRLAGLLAARARGADPCPVLAWGVHDVNDPQAQMLAKALAARPDVQAPVAIRRFASYRRARGGWRLGWPAAYVFERAGAGSAARGD